MWWMAGLLNLDTGAVMRDAGLLGRLLDTFVASQLRAELAVATSRPHLYHLRRDGGRNEIDILAEPGADRVIGFEIKATAAPKAADARHLAWLRDALEDRFVAGIVFHTGPGRFEMSERITALPIWSLWA